MQLKEIMTPHVEVIAPDATLQDAARRMKELDVGLMPVCDGDRITGMLTDRDITIRATASGNDPRTTPVREVMSTDIVSCFQDQDEQDAARLMEQHQIRRLIVVDRDKHLAGIISLGDLATRAGRGRAAAALHGVSQER